jgi:hypothetical protein
VSPRLAFSKATDLLPVTGPVSSQKRKATLCGSPFLINPVTYSVGSGLKAHVPVLNRH